MTITYAVADLHDRYDLLEAALAEIEKRAPGTVVFLGDYVDRGPQSRQIIDKLMAGPMAGWKWICLQGNHEVMMLQAIWIGLDLESWLRNGGGATLLSYGHSDGGEYDPAVVPEPHLEWISRLPLLHVDEHRVFVHAGLAPDRALDEQEPEVVQWKRYAEGADEGHDGRHVVHGHDPVSQGPLLLSKRTDLDTLAWSTGRLVVGVFADEVPGGPIELIEIRGAAGAPKVRPPGSVWRTGGGR